MTPAALTPTPPFYRKKPLLVLYLAALALFVVYLLFSSTIVLVLTGARGKVQGLQSLPPTATAKAYYGINWDIARSDVTLSHIMAGYAVLEVPGGAEIEHPYANEWSIDLLFVSEKASFRVPTGQTWRLDIYNNFYGNPNFIPAYSYGFTAEFPALAMPNGEYMLYLDVKQGAEASGMVQTDYLYRMDGTGLHLLSKGGEAPEGTITDEVTALN